MKSKDIFSFLSGAILTFLCGYFFYFKSRIDTFETQIQTCYEEKKECETEVQNYKELDKKNRILENDNEQKFREILDLTDKIRSKDDDLIIKDIELDEKENELRELRNELNNIIKSGTSKELRTVIESLNVKVGKLEEEKRRLENEKDNIEKEKTALSDKIFVLENQISDFRNIIIPEYKDSIVRLNSFLEEQKVQNVLNNFRCSIAKIEIFMESNELGIQLNFSQEDLNLLNRYYKNRNISLIPIVENKSSGLVLMPRILNFEHFTLPKNNLRSNFIINFVPSNIEFRKYYKKKSALNMSKGDNYSVKIVFEELDRKVIGEQLFYLEKK